MALVHVDDGKSPQVATAPSPDIRVLGAGLPQRERLRVHSLRMPSVVRVSLLVTVAVVAALLFASVLVWWLARTSGAVGSVESFVAGALGLETFSIPGRGVLLVWAGIVGFAAVAGLAATVLLTLIYNRVAELVGGIEVEAVIRRPASLTRDR